MIFADQLVAANPGKHLWLPQSRKLDFRAVQARVRRAERLVFDASASARVGELIRDIPELLIEQVQFARAPFDLCWIEYQSDVTWEIVVGREGDQTDGDRDEVVGLLVDHNRVNVFNRCYDGTIGMMPWVYHLNTEWPLEDQLRFCEAAKVSRLGIDTWLWGSTANALAEKGRYDALRVLRNTNMVEVIDESPNTTKAILSGGAHGDFKNVIALLLALNQPQITQYQHVPQSRGWIGNKPKPFLSHHSVKVSLDAQRRLLTHFEHGEGELRRRHRVRGHYCHDQVARDYSRIAGCVHDWEPMDDQWLPWPDAPLDEREHWRCRACEGKRWWRVAHQRGSEAKGFIEHEYQVTA